MNFKNSQRIRVFVGLTGGVDSSVALALLKEQGYEVTGVFIKVWQPDFLPCNWKEDRLDAMRVCAELSVPFITLDLTNAYKQEVVDYMIDSYQQGFTPNPDVMCNKQVKFGTFLLWAKERGADFVATGHYAQRLERKNGFVLYEGSDKNKDQSYFLWTLTQEKLSRILFPVGDLEKPGVRKLAEKYHLPTAEKKDSQGLCFIGKLDMREFLKHYVDTTSGVVINEKGEKIGEHEGVLLYTIGQRHGFTIKAQTTHEKPYYVVAKDIKRNTLTVSHMPLRSITLSEQKTLNLKEVNWIFDEPKEGDEYFARVRYRRPLQRCKIVEMGEEHAGVLFYNAQISAKGQSVVLYQGDGLCLGGGVIR